MGDTDDEFQAGEDKPMNGGDNAADALALQIHKYIRKVTDNKFVLPTLNHLKVVCNCNIYIFFYHDMTHTHDGTNNHLLLITLFF